MSPTTLISLLQQRAGQLPLQRGFTFLEDDGSERHLTYGELDRRARVIAAALRAQVQPGERALLLFAPGLEYIEALFGCLYAGVLAVPAYPPDVMRLQRTLPRLQAIVADSGASLLLTTQGIHLLAGELITQAAPDLARLRWLTTDTLEEGASDAGRLDDVAPGTLAFLQYTSGSTGSPKGVMLSHTNLLHNCELIYRAFGHGPDSRGVIWLPPYHDMGLIGGILQPLYGAFPTVLMSPLGFLSRPLRWLQAISEHRATTSGGPNFAYDLCVRKTTPEQRAALDLSCWRVAFSGAEPIRTDTLDRFVEAFGPAGFRREAFYPCYGLAEATLIVSGGRVEAPPVVARLDSDAYARGQVADAGASAREPLGAVGCGEPLQGLEVRIVEPQSRQPCAPDRVGELWVRGASVATGYWGQPGLSQETFQARLASTDEGPFLRTGDLGFLRGGELYVTGRLKDLIIIRGRNHYPQDLERTVEQSHPALRPGCGAAFPVEVAAEERLVVVQELDPRQSADVEQVLSSIVEAVIGTHEVRPHEVLLIKPGSLPKTSSGKVQRRACRALHAEGGLEVLAARLATPESQELPASGSSAGSRAEAAPRGDLEEQLATLLAGCLRMTVEQLDRRVAITAYGLDSLGAVELQGQVEARLGVALPIGALLDGPTLEVLAGRVAQAHATPSLRTDSRARSSTSRETSALSLNQQGLWFLHQLDPTSPVYNVTSAVRLRGELSPEALRTACQRLVERHPVLRTTFTAVDHRPVARIAPAGEVDFTQQDVSGWRDAALEQYLAQQTRRPFDLERGPLMRVTLLRHGADATTLLLCLHHLVTDFWSVGLMARELSALYTGARRDLAVTLPAPALSFADYVEWETRVLAGPEGERHRRYWEQQLGGEALVFDPPTDKPRALKPSFEMHSARVHVSAEVTARLRRLATERGATLHAVVLAAYQTLLSRWSGQEQLRVGSYASGRGRAGLETLAGYLVNPVVLQADLRGAPVFSELLRRTQRTLVDALEHQPYPFVKLVEHFQPQREPSRSPLFQAGLTWERTPGEPGQSLVPFNLGGEGGRLEWSGLTLEALPPLPRYQETDVWLEIGEAGPELRGLLSLRADLFEASTAGRLASHLVTLLEGIAQAPERPLSALPLLTPAEREQVLHAWNPPPVVTHVEPCLHQLFEAQVKRAPEAIAVRCEGQQLTYAQLNRRANQLAHRLGELGVRPGDTVGLSLERSVEMVAALLGTLKAGAAYLPIDASYPLERVAWMVEDARPAVVLAHSSLASRLPETARVVLLDEERARLERQPEHDPVLAVMPELLAYVIYTSGTTGRPKGVMVSHANATRLWRVMAPWLQLDASGVSALFHSIAFDMSVLELWAALLYGGRVQVVTQEVSRNPTRFYELLREEHVTFITQTPSAFRALLSAEQERGAAQDLSLRTILLGGEKLETQMLRPWFEAHGDRTPRVVNIYGPTEITVYNTYRHMRAADLIHGRSLLGESIPDMQLYLLDRHLEPVPVGFTGEIYIGGPGVSVGYLRRPELTAQRFLADPFRPREGGARLYRTGDLARRMPDGDLEYVSRMDHQVKLRGFRVELGEIESVLAEQPQVKEAVALVREDVPGVAQLVAYLVPRAGQHPDPAELRRALGSRLPEYMLPSAFVELEALPLNHNGKLDRRALPAPALAKAQGSQAAPRTELEARLATLWAELLRVESVGVEDSFFDLGGHSLMATQLVSRVREQLGVEVPLRALFEGPTVAALARYVERMRATQAPQAGAPSRIERGARSADPELSFAQQRLWFLDQLAPRSASYHVSGALRLQGPLHSEVLQRALQEVVRRHEVLRTTFSSAAGKPSQVIHPPGALVLPVVELGSLPEAVRRAEVERLALAEAQRPFDLSTGPLLRGRLLRLSAEEHVLVLSMHHIVSDGWSIEVLARETATLYAAFSAQQPSPLPELPIQYADYAAWQREELRGPALQRQLDWWKEQLAGAPPVLELPTDRPRPPVQGFRGARHRVELSAGLADALRELARGEGATLFMTLLAAFQALLGRYANQRDVVVGTPIANRTRMETEPLIGFFANTLAMRARLANDVSFRSLLAQVKQTALGAFAHQDLPFERLVEELQPTRDLSHAPVFQVMFALQEPMRALALPGLTLSRLELEDGTAKFELMLTLEDTGSALTGAFEYNTDLFDAGSVRRLAEHFTVLLQGLIAHPERPLSELSLLGTEERAHVLHAGASSLQATEESACIHALFEAQAAHTPEALAVLHGEERLSYRELNARANQLARHLRQRGVGPEDRVGVCLERSHELVVALLGVLKAGAAYVPLDPSYPRERLRWLSEDSRTRVLITSGASGASGAETLVQLDRDASELSRLSPEDLGPTAHPEGVAYVLYTSGSTGTPKGVMISHAALHNHMRWMQREFPLAGGDRVLQRTPLSFDASVWEFYAPLLAGATLVMGGPDAHRDPTDLVRTVQRHQVSTLQLVPTLLQQLLETPGVEACASLRRVFCGGEALTPELVERFATRLPSAQLINLYGPTEATIDASFHVCAPGARRRVPIGRPIDHTRLYVLDAGLEPVPVGVPGELFIGGAGLGRGYLGRAELTAERFVPDPFSDQPGARLYRTGDLALWRPDGPLEYLGRRDQQVKLRGVRIELPELEATLAQHPRVRRAVVGVHPGPRGPQLVAHVEASDVEGAELRDFMTARLPAAMVPSAYVLLEALPLLPNGKVDRRRLPSPESVDPAEARESAAPRDETETFLARVWAEVLGLPRVGIHDDFFALGGHSLLATQVMSRVREHFQSDLPLRLLFEAPTVARLAQALGPRSTASSAPPAPPAPPASPEPLLDPVDQMTPEQLDRLLTELDSPESAP